MTTPNINTLLRAEPTNSSRGAPMGASSRLDDPDLPLYVQRIQFIDGDYAADGTYWADLPPRHCGAALPAPSIGFMCVPIPGLRQSRKS